jgi:hypothetical protein
MARLKRFLPDDFGSGCFCRTDDARLVLGKHRLVQRAVEISARDVQVCCVFRWVQVCSPGLLAKYVGPFLCFCFGEVVVEVMLITSVCRTLLLRFGVQITCGPGSPTQQNSSVRRSWIGPGFPPSTFMKDVPGGIGAAATKMMACTWFFGCSAEREAASSPWRALFVGRPP